MFNEEGKFLRRIGCDNVTNFPNGIDISDAGDILIGDSHGNRFHVAVFSRDGSLISEFECPYVKVQTFKQFLRESILYGEIIDIKTWRYLEILNGRNSMKNERKSY